MTRGNLPFESAVATGRGDDGTTGLLFGGDRVRKDSLRIEACGTIDEAVAGLGLARAELGMKAQYGVLSPNFGSLGELILRFQRELFVVGAELATTPGAHDRQQDGVSRVSREMVEGIEAALRDIEAAVGPPTQFVVPGETRLSATLELARTGVRRAERRVVTLASVDEDVTAGHVLPYLNRLADLLWILARLSEKAEAKDATMVRDGSRAKRARAATGPAPVATPERSPNP
jgi:cob(I)alamin adenosyltransferase